METFINKIKTQLKNNDLTYMPYYYTCLFENRVHHDYDLIFSTLNLIEKHYNNSTQGIFISGEHVHTYYYPDDDIP